jgi:hypothetical protein
LLITLEASLTLDHQDASEIFTQGFLDFYKHMGVPTFANMIEIGTASLKPDDHTFEASLPLEHCNNT